jgi:putative hydrolase of the HAD superfamily
MPDMRGVLFDLDETLIDRSNSIARYAAEFHLQFESCLTQCRTDFVASFIRLDGNGYVSRPEFFERLAAHIDDPRLPPERIGQHFLDNIWERPLLVDGALAGLARLRQLQIPVAVVTNGGSRNQLRKITNSGLAELLDGWTISEDLGIKKPDHRIFQSAAAGLGIDPRQSWFVGDHPLLDIRGASDVGFQTIWLERNTQWPGDMPPCYTHGPCTLEEAFRRLYQDLS